MQEYGHMSMTDTNILKNNHIEEPDEDWFGTDQSCCFCSPIFSGVKMMGFYWVVNFVFLAIQIHGITDDGSSKHENARPQFYYVSYIIISPFLFTFYRYLRWLLSDSLDHRNNLVSGSFVATVSVAALYVWFFIYFSNLEATDFLTMDKILLILLLFAVP